MSDVEHVLGVQDQAGETPIWLPGERALYWADIEGNLVHRLEPATSWITATKVGLAFWDDRTNAFSPIVDPEADRPDCRCNDGVVDRQGRFLVGTLNQADLNAPDGSLYRLDADGSLHKLDTHLAVANGIGLSPDGRTLYVTDMFHGRILAYDYDPAGGSADGRRVFVEVPPEAGLPDGLIVDAEGCVWSAHWGGWRATRYDPDGRTEREIRLPVANVTCFAFGGDELAELYITTAWFGLTDAQRTEQPLAGDLFRVKTDVRGLVEPEFAG